MAQIKKINIGRTVYDIYDASAIHDLKDIQNLGLEGAFIYKGTVATVAELPAAGNSVGSVYHVIENGSEYVWISEGRWEEFGHHMVVEHTHDFSISHSANCAVTVEGHNAESEVTGTGTGSISVPKIAKEANYIKIESSISEVGVSAAGTANVITGLGDPTTTKVITDLKTTTVNSTTSSDVSIPNVTSNTEVTVSKVTTDPGAAALWEAVVSDDGVLSFNWTTNKPTGVTAEDKTVSQVTLGAEIAASKVTTSEVSVVSGSKSTADVISALGAPTTASCITGVSVTNQPTIEVVAAVAEAADDGAVLVGDTVAVTSETKDVSVSVTGKAAAQTWTQDSGSAACSFNISGTTEMPKSAD